jgi:hypothetical protein
MAQAQAQAPIALREKIKSHGVVLGGGILKVSSFVNHQGSVVSMGRDKCVVINVVLPIDSLTHFFSVDVGLMDLCGECECSVCVVDMHGCIRACPSFISVPRA